MSDDKKGMKKERCDTLIQEREVMSWQRNPQPDDAGVKDMRAAVEKEPENAEKWMELGLAYANVGYYREAAECYSHAISIDPFDWRFYRHRAHRFISCNLFQDGAADFTIATRLNPKDWNCWYHLGLAYFLLEDYEKALEAYKTCYSLNETTDDLCASTDWYWMTLKRLGRDEDAAKLLERITTGMDAGDNTAYYARLMVYKGLKKAEDVLSTDPTKITDLERVTYGFGIGNYYMINGEEDKAIDVWKQVIKAGDENDLYFAFSYLASKVELTRRGLL